MKKIIKTPEDAVKVLKAEAKALDPNPEPGTIKRVITKLLHDLAAIKNMSPEKRVAIIRRFGKFLVSKGYAEKLMYAIYVGGMIEHVKRSLKITEVALKHANTGILTLAWAYSNAMLTHGVGVIFSRSIAEVARNAALHFRKTRKKSAGN